MTKQQIWDRINELQDHHDRGLITRKELDARVSPLLWMAYGRRPRKPLAIDI